MSEPPSRRTRVQRGAKRAVYDRQAIESIIDSAPYCSVSTITPDGLRQIPLSHVRGGAWVYFHGHARNAVLGALASGAEACVSFVVVDGLVFGRSAASHSVNFHSVVLYGHGRAVEEEAEKLHALRLLTDRFVPGRWSEVSPPAPADLDSTLVVALSTAEASAKIREGGPRLRAGEADAVWAGVVPLRLAAGEALPVPEAEGLPPPRLAWPRPEG